MKIDLILNEDLYRLPYVPLFKLLVYKCILLNKWKVSVKTQAFLPRKIINWQKICNTKNLKQRKQNNTQKNTDFLKKDSFYICW